MTLIGVFYAFWVFAYTINSLNRVSMLPGLLCGGICIEEFGSDMFLWANVDIPNLSTNSAVDGNDSNLLVWMLDSGDLGLAWGDFN